MSLRHLDAFDRRRPLNGNRSGLRPLLLLAVSLLSPLVGSALAQDFPTRPITLMVPFPPGGSSDVVMRLVAAKAAEYLKQPIVIDNRPGAAGNVAAMALKSAPRDGYMLMMGHTGTHAINPTLYGDLKFDPLKDFAPITALIAFNNILMVPADSPAKAVADLVKMAKAKPDGLTYASQGLGTGGHLLGVLFANSAGIKLVHVPYRGIAPAITDAVAGRVDFVFSSYLSAAGFVESGKLRMLAIAGDQRHSRIANVPTMAEAGFPEVQMQQWFGLFAPAGTPESVVRRLNVEFVRALDSEEVRSKLLPEASSVTPSTPEQLQAMVARDMERLGRIVKDAGAKAQD